MWVRLRACAQLSDATAFFSAATRTASAGFRRQTAAAHKFLWVPIRFHYGPARVT